MMMTTTTAWHSHRPPVPLDLEVKVAHLLQRLDVDRVQLYCMTVVDLYSSLTSIHNYFSLIYPECLNSEPSTRGNPLYPWVCVKPIPVPVKTRTHRHGYGYRLPEKTPGRPVIIPMDDTSIWIALKKQDIVCGRPRAT
jgi:hypothetical protein